MKYIYKEDGFFYIFFLVYFFYEMIAFMIKIYKIYLKKRKKIVLDGMIPHKLCNSH